MWNIVQRIAAVILILLCLMAFILVDMNFDALLTEPLIMVVGILLGLALIALALVFYAEVKIQIAKEQRVIICFWSVRRKRWVARLLHREDALGTGDTTQEALVALIKKLKKLGLPAHQKDYDEPIVYS